MKDQGEVCGICGGDGRIANAFGSHTTCPGCHGSGRRQETEGFRDVTKTKASHHKPPVSRTPAGPAGPPAPSTPSGQLLAGEITNSLASVETKAKLIREIIEYEDSHGQCTQTFTKKIRKQFRPRA